MRHLTAHQLPEGGWHYASTHRTGGYPLGYCAEHEPHATEDEARECYRRWQRDHVKLDDGGKWSWGNCHVKGCDNPARNGVTIEGDGYALAFLCDEHHDREHALTALGLDGDRAGDAWIS